MIKLKNSRELSSKRIRVRYIDLAENLLRDKVLISNY